MTVSLELDAEARRRGISSVFVPTGQTGIAIAGWGIAVDAVIADFIAGSAERLVLEGVERGGELLWVEGQGSLTHPQYSGVTMGLFHGSAPHALVLCHVPGQEFVNDEPRFPMPSLSSLVELHERTALIARPAPVAAIALNTRGMSDEDARSAVAEAEQETRLPADDRCASAPESSSTQCSPGSTCGRREARDHRRHPPAAWGPASARGVCAEACRRRPDPARRRFLDRRSAT